MTDPGQKMPELPNRLFITAVIGEHGLHVFKLMRESDGGGKSIIDDKFLNFPVDDYSFDLNRKGGSS